MYRIRCLFGGCIIVFKSWDIRKKAQSRNNIRRSWWYLSAFTLSLLFALLDLVFWICCVQLWEKKEKEDSSGYLYIDGRSRRKHAIDVYPLLVHMSFHLEIQKSYMVDLSVLLRIRYFEYFVWRWGEDCHTGQCICIVEQAQTSTRLFNVLVWCAWLLTLRNRSQTWSNG